MRKKALKAEANSGLMLWGRIEGAIIVRKGNKGGEVLGHPYAGKSPLKGITSLSRQFVEMSADTAAWP